MVIFSRLPMLLHVLMSDIDVFILMARIDVVINIDVAT
jgi:hypothetical protein